MDIEKIGKVVEEIFLDAIFKRETKPYKNIYFIKPLNPGDRVQFFCSFRYKASNNECVICRVDIDLEKPERNTMIGISYLEVRKRQSFTFFKKNLHVLNKTIPEILKQIAIPELTEKLIKIEGMVNGPDRSNP